MSSEFKELRAFTDKMNAEGLPAELIAHFSRLYCRYRCGETGIVPWSEVTAPEPTDLIPYSSMLDARYVEHGRSLLKRLACIKLNGGLGTTMSLDCTKSLIPVRCGRTFLDLIVSQVETVRRRCAAPLPLLLMNSFRTHDESLKALNQFEQPDGLPLGFVQHKVPRIEVASHGPAAFANPDREWAPPGHGDVYMALWLSGVLQQLIQCGYTWAFVSNADNLAATVDPAIVGYLDKHGVDFAMEVTPKTHADIKGGTLIRHRGRLSLLERAQVAAEHIADFEDIQAFRVFNTNTLWWRLEAILRRLERADLDLDIIVNPKRIGTKDVVQLETAMGAAIGCFERSVGVMVTRDRFAPVKATSDLLVVRSDACVLDESGALRPNPKRPADWGPPVVRLDRVFYRALDDFDGRFADPPSLLNCKRLVIEGDIVFGRGVVVSGAVVLRNSSGVQQIIPDGTHLGDTTLSW